MSRATRRRVRCLRLLSQSGADVEGWRAVPAFNLRRRIATRRTRLVSGSYDGGSLAVAGGERAGGKVAACPPRPAPPAVRERLAAIHAVVRTGMRQRPGTVRGERRPRFGGPRPRKRMKDPAVPALRGGESRADEVVKEIQLCPCSRNSWSRPPSMMSPRLPETAARLRRRRMRRPRARRPGKRGRRCGPAQPCRGNR